MCHLALVTLRNPNDTVHRCHDRHYERCVSVIFPRLNPSMLQELSMLASELALSKRQAVAQLQSRSDVRPLQWRLQPYRAVVQVEQVKQLKGRMRACVDSELGSRHAIMSLTPSATGRSSPPLLRDHGCVWSPLGLDSLLLVLHTLGKSIRQHPPGQQHLLTQPTRAAGLAAGAAWALGLLPGSSAGRSECRAPL